MFLSQFRNGIQEEEEESKMLWKQNDECLQIARREMEEEEKEKDEAKINENHLKILSHNTNDSQ